MHLHKNKEYVNKNQISRVGIIEINIKLKLAIKPCWKSIEVPFYVHSLDNHICRTKTYQYIEMLIRREKVFTYMYIQTEKIPQRWLVSIVFLWKHLRVLNMVFAFLGGKNMHVITFENAIG